MLSNKGFCEDSGKTVETTQQRKFNTLTKKFHASEQSCLLQQDRSLTRDRVNSFGIVAKMKLPFGLFQEVIKLTTILKGWLRHMANAKSRKCCWNWTWAYLKKFGEDWNLDEKGT